MTQRGIDRRRFLTLAGTAFTVVAAGCTDGAPENDGNGGDDETEDGEIGGDNETEDGREGEDDDGEDDETGADNESEDGETGADNETDGGDETGDGGDAEEVVVGPEGDFVFEPEELTISSGTTVTFVWDSDTHNIAVESQPEDADWEGHEEIENEGFEHEHTFEVPGEYEYVCEPHEAQGMTGTIIVEEG